MSEIKNKIEKAIRAIAKAESIGKDTTTWQEHVIKLVNELEKQTVKVKVGKFGFCTCSKKGGLCVGCWRIKQACDCEEIDVDPEVEMTRQYKARRRGAN